MAGRLADATSANEMVISMRFMVQIYDIVENYEHSVQNYELLYLALNYVCIDY